VALEVPARDDNGWKVEGLLRMVEVCHDVAGTAPVSWACPGHSTLGLYLMVHHGSSLSVHPGLWLLVSDSREHRHISFHQAVGPGKARGCYRPNPHPETHLDGIDGNVAPLAE
jgi:hypothetical protein